MADYLSGLGEGIAFSGKAQTFEGLRSRMLGIEQEKRKQREKAFTDLMDFDVGSGKYFPAIANAIAKEKSDYINKIQTDAKKFGIEKAININSRDKMAVKKRIEQLEATNENIKALTTAKGLSPRTQQVIELFSKPEPKPEEIGALNDKNTGVYTDGTLYNFRVQPFTKINIPERVLKYKDNIQPLREATVKGVGGNKVVVGTVMGLPQHYKEMLAMELSSDEDFIRNYFYSKEKANREKYPDLFSDDEDKKQAANAAMAMDAINEFYPERVKQDVRAATFTPKYEQEKKENKEEFVVSGNTVENNLIRFEVMPTNTGNVISWNVKQKGGAENKPINFTIIKYMHGNKEVIRKDGKEYYKATGKEVTAPKKEITEKVVEVGGEVSNAEYNPKTKKGTMKLLYESGTGKSKVTETFTIDISPNTPVGKENLNKFKAVYGINPIEAYEKVNGSGGVTVTQKTGGATATPSTGGTTQKKGTTGKTHKMYVPKDVIKNGKVVIKKGEHNVLDEDLQTFKKLAGL